MVTILIVAMLIVGVTYGPLAASVLLAAIALLGTMWLLHPSRIKIRRDNKDG